MKTMLISCMLGLALLTAGGCGSEQTTAAGGGFIAGWTMAMRQASDAIEQLAAATDEANAQTATIKQLLEENPTALVNVVDPNAGIELTRLIANIEAAKEKDFDWLTLAIMGLGIFGGGTGVNLYKNRKTGK